MFIIKYKHFTFKNILAIVLNLVLYCDKKDKIQELRCRTQGLARRNFSCDKVNPYSGLSHHLERVATIEHLQVQIGDDNQAAFFQTVEHFSNWSNTDFIDSLLLWFLSRRWCRRSYKFFPIMIFGGWMARWKERWENTSLDITQPPKEGAWSALFSNLSKSGLDNYRKVKHQIISTDFPFLKSTMTKVDLKDRKLVLLHF